MAMPKINRRLFWKNYGITLGIITFFFAVIFFMTRATKSSWNEGLKQSVISVIDEHEPDKWQIGHAIPIKSTFATSAALYELHNTDSPEQFYAIIIRISTLYGHFPAVYIYNKNKGTSFVGYTAVKGRVKNLLEYNNVGFTVTYWLDKIPEIIEKSIGTGAAKK